MTKQAIREGFERLRPGDQLAPLEAAARSRSEADWLVGMNATRAATIRGRAWVGGVVSLGRVQTPTLAMIVKREREIQAFVPEPYWLVHATFEPAATPGSGSRATRPASRTAPRADAIVENVAGKDGTVESVERKEQSERPPLLYDLTIAPARREPPLRLLRAPDAPGRPVALRGQEGDHLSADLVPLPLGRHGSAAQAGGRDARADLRVRGARARVRARARPAPARGASSTTPRSTTTTRSSRRRSTTTSRGVHARRAPDLRPGRAPLPRRVPSACALRSARPSSRRSRASGSGRAARSRSRRAGAASTGSRPTPTRSGSEEDDGEGGRAAALEQGQTVRCIEAESEAKETRPPPRYTEATLLSAMETAGKLIDDEELREAMKDTGLGTPATRAETIETLIRREYIERVGKDLLATPKGIQVIDDARGAQADLARAHRRLGEASLRDIEHGSGDRDEFMNGIAGLHARDRRADRRARQGEAAARARRARASARAAAP